MEANNVFKLDTLFLALQPLICNSIYLYVPLKPETESQNLLDTEYSTPCPLSLPSDCSHCPQAVVVPNFPSDMHNVYLSVVMECKMRTWVVKGEV